VKGRALIEHPGERHAVAAVVAGTELAVATSGNYERGDLIIDPRTGARRGCSPPGSRSGPGMADSGPRTSAPAA